MKIFLAKLILFSDTIEKSYDFFRTQSKKVMKTTIF